MDQEEEQTPTICLLGSVGTGKSSTGNSIFGEEVFETGEQAESVTSKPCVKVRRWQGDGEIVRCVDLPGLSDTPELDKKHMKEMVEVLRDQVRYIHTFLIVINSQAVRFDRQTQVMLTQFNDVFGDEFLRNAMLAFTRWEYRRSARKQREKKGVSEETKAQEFNTLLKTLLRHDFACTCVFLNNALTTLSEEELEDEYCLEVPEVMQAFKSELRKVHSFMRSRAPFLCRNIEAVLAEREEKRQLVQMMLPQMERWVPEELGRHIILADNDFIRGWLRWRRPPGPPKAMWAVLRRQHLEFFSDNSEATQDGPQDIELTSSICGKSGWHPLSRHCFLIYKPVQDEPDVHSVAKYEFGVDSEHDRRRWTYLVQEATRISESWSRILAFHKSLHSADTLVEYVQAINKVAHETMVVPMEWVRHCKRRREGSPTRAGPAASTNRQRWNQAQKDLTRDAVSLDGRALRQPTAEDLMTDVLLRLLKWARAKSPGGGNSRTDLESRALLLARDVVLNCSQTEGTGDVLDAVRELFVKEGLVESFVGHGPSSPICVRIPNPDCPERVLQEEYMKAAFSSCTGLPKFQSDQGATTLDIEKVRHMDTDAEQRLQGRRVGEESWMPDWEMLQCMKCGISFSRTWVWRHHCRSCGVLVCRNCSQHSIELVEQCSLRAETGRVCFTCYQKAVIDDLNSRRPSGAAEARGEATTALLDSDEHEPKTLSSELSSSFSSEEEEEGTWPVITIEMKSTYRLCSLQDPSPKELFLLRCKHVRQVRWRGVADTGRVVISIEEV
mmetsp:Transcript_49779/g.115538  ORF Transcript_49779/g.115538 Transcript_49779/m.115538 type:complete len:783 (+) Transcript_49779:41-2389(+)